MSLPSDSRDAELPMLAYVAVLASVFGLFALGLHWLQQPSVIPNPGLAAYKPPPGMAVPLATSSETLMSMEQSAELAARDARGERQEGKAPEQKQKRTAQTHSRKPPRVAERRSRWPWGYAENPYSGFGRWF